MEILTEENARAGLSVVETNHPEWGAKRLNFEFTMEGGNHWSVGTGSNTKMITDMSEFGIAERGQ